MELYWKLNLLMANEVAFVSLTIKHRREGISSGSGMNVWLQHLNSWRQSWDCFICPMWVCRGPAGSNQVEEGESIPPLPYPPPSPTAGTRLLKFVSQVSSLASQKSGGGLQSDRDASKGPPHNTERKKKRERLNHIRIFFFQKWLKN